MTGNRSHQIGQVLALKDDGCFRSTSSVMPSNSKYLAPLGLLATLGTGLMAGLFFAFSTFIMHALSRLPPEQGMAAMQHINAAVTTALFGLTFFGTAVVCLVIILATFRKARSSVPAALLLAGSLLYVVGVFGITVAFNVPLNNALAGTAAAQAAEYWPAYVQSWLAWNHVRTTVASAALVCFAWGLYKAGAQPAT